MDERPGKNLILYNILYVVFRRIHTLTILCTISFLLIIFFTYLTTPTYKRTAKILIRPNPQQQLILFRDLATPGREVQTVNPARNLIQILTSQEIAQEVVEKFRLDERLRKKEEKPEELRDIIRRSLFRAITYPISLVKNLLQVEKQPTNFFEKAVEHLIKDDQDIELEEDSHVINLGIWEETPGLSSGIANYMAQLLIEKSTQLDQTNAREAYNFTKEQVRAAERSLGESEAELIRFRKKKKIISLEEQKKAKLDELHMVENQYLNVKAELSEAQAKLKEMRREISAQKERLSDSPIFVNNHVMKELINSLNSAEIQLAGELEKFSESSKNVKRLRAQASESQDKIEKELKAIAKSDSAILHSVHPDLPREHTQLTANVAALTAKKDVLQNEMKALKAEAFSLSMMETELERLKRRRETNEKLYIKLLDKFSELGVQQVSKMIGYDLKIIAKAFVSKDARPDWPKWLLAIPLGFVGSILLSFGTVFFIEYWDESFKSPAEIEDRLALPVLCTVPDIK